MFPFLYRAGCFLPTLVFIILNIKPIDPSPVLAGFAAGGRFQADANNRLQLSRRLPRMGALLKPVVGINMLPGSAVCGRGRGVRKRRTWFLSPHLADPNL
jgi:hypothetical protein